MKTKKILTIDFRAPCIYQKVSAVQGDSGVQIVCNLASITEHDGATVRVYAKKPSGLELYNDCVLIDNKVIIDVTTQMIAEIGMAKCQIQFTNGTDIITSYEFGISVEKSLVNSSAVESSNEFTALENALKKVDGLDISESEINFTDAIERVDLITKEKSSVLIGKISKWLKDLKNIAFTGEYDDLSNRPTLGDSASKNTANNLTTDVEGSVLDARQGKVLQEKITAINNNLLSFNEKDLWTGNVTEEKNIELSDDITKYNFVQFTFGGGSYLYSFTIRRASIISSSYSRFTCGTASVGVKLINNTTLNVTNNASAAIRNIVGFKIPTL